jgi:hypothetical protein
LLDPANRDKLLDEWTKHPGYFFTSVFRKTSAMLATERWPFPPGDHVTLARIVHLLAFRTVARRHESMPDGQWVNAPHEWRYLEYLNAALTLNDAIDSAAKAGAFRLRDRSTGVPVTDWHLPTRGRRDSLKRAILEGDQRRAIDFVLSTDWLINPYPHYSPALTVSLAEFVAWAEGEGVATPGEIGRLLVGQPKEIPTVAEILKAAFPVFGGGGTCNPERTYVIANAGLYPESRREPEGPAGQVVADHGAPDSEAKAPPERWRNGLKRIAYEEAANLVRNNGKLHGPALWGAMCAHNDVKEAGRNSGQIELKICVTGLSRGEARVSKTQVQNAWRKDLSELLE